MSDTIIPVRGWISYSILRHTSGSESFSNSTSYSMSAAIHHGCVPTRRSRSSTSLFPSTTTILPLPPHTLQHFDQLTIRQSSCQVSFFLAVCSCLAQNANEHSPPHAHRFRPCKFTFQSIPAFERSLSFYLLHSSSIPSVPVIFLVKLGSLVVFRAPSTDLTKLPANIRSISGAYDKQRLSSLLSIGLRVVLMGS